MNAAGVMPAAFIVSPPRIQSPGIRAPRRTAISATSAPTRRTTTDQMGVSTATTSQSPIERAVVNGGQ